MNTKKAGCFLLNVKNKTIALVYREKQKDFSFPKGHLENEELLEDCAVRETAEETKRTAKIIKEIDPIIEKYKTPAGEECECYMYVAIDCGGSDNNSTDSHQTFFIPIKDVETKLTYENLKKTWNFVKPQIDKFLEKYYQNSIYLNKKVLVKMDRPLGSKHPKHGFIYSVNYGYIPNTISGDGEELDAYVLGEHKSLDTFEGEVIAIIHRINDNDDKLVVMAKGKNYTDEQIRALTEFQEQYFESIIIRK